MQHLMHAVDWLPTLAEAAGLNVSDALTNMRMDGVSHWRNLQGQQDEEARQSIFYGYTCGYPKKRSGGAVRNLRWKLIRGPDTCPAPLNRMPGGPWFCTPNCVNCSTSKHYDFLDHECPKESHHGAIASPRHLTEAVLAPFAKDAHVQIQLYDLLTDPAETTDVSASEPEVLKQLGALLDEWEAQTYLGPGEDPAMTYGCPHQQGFPNHDGPKHVPVAYPWCELPSTAKLV